MCINEAQKPQGDELKLTLPDKSCLIARVDNEPNYPGINIFLLDANEIEELVCFAEFNSERPSGRELCLGAYTSVEDDTVYYDNYRKEGPRGAV